MPQADVATPIGQDREFTRRGGSPRRAHLLLLAVLGGLFVAYGSFVPLEHRELTWGAAVELFKQRMDRADAPFRITDVGVNIMLFVPLGFLWLGAVDIDLRRRWLSAAATPVILALLAAWSVAIEFGQLWFPKRTLSPYDIAAQVGGAAIGVTLWWVAGRAVVRAVRQATGGRSRASRLQRILQLYAMGLVVYSVQPFDIALSLDAIGAQFRDGRILLRPFAHTYKDAFDLAWQVGVDALLFVPIGVMFRLGRDGLRTILGATLRALLLALLIELIQLAIYSRYADVTDLITQTAGAWVGAVFAARLPLERDEAPRRDAQHKSNLIPAIALAHIYAIPLIAIFAAPFHPVQGIEQFLHRLHGMFDWPFKAYYAGSEFAALTGMVRCVMLFVPIGALMRWGAAKPDRTPGFGFALLLIVNIAWGLGFLIEAVQAATVNHHPDITDILLYTIGTAIGWWLWSAVTYGASDSPPSQGGAGGGSNRT